MIQYQLIQELLLQLVVEMRKECKYILEYFLFKSAEGGSCQQSKIVNRQSTIRRSFS